MQIDDAIDALQEREGPTNESSEGSSFALAPKLVEINTPINYSTRIRAELYRSGSSSLRNREEDTLSVFTDVLMD